MARGKKTGGRQKGTTNKATAARQQKIEASGLTPLDFMLSIMRNTDLPLVARFDAARHCAPYVHPKLSAIEHTGADAFGNPIVPTIIMTGRPSDAELKALQEQWRRERPSAGGKVN